MYSTILIVSRASWPCFWARNVDRWTTLHPETAKTCEHFHPNPRRQRDCLIKDQRLVAKTRVSNNPELLYLTCLFCNSPAFLSCLLKPRSETSVGLSLSPLPQLNSPALHPFPHNCLSPSISHSSFILFFTSSFLYGRQHTIKNASFGL